MQWPDLKVSDQENHECHLKINGFQSEGVLCVKYVSEPNNLRICYAERKWGWVSRQTDGQTVVEWDRQMDHRRD